MKQKSEEKQVGPVAMLAPADQPNGVHVSLPDGTTFHIPAGEKATLVPVEFREAALEAGALPAAAGTPTAEEKAVIEDEAAAEARNEARKAGR